MKKIVLILSSIALMLSVNAQTIALHSSTGVQIFHGASALVDAYTVAQNTDTLYLSGHSFTPPTPFDKQLIIYGAGHYVDSTLATGKTSFNGTVLLSENADGFHLEGVEINGQFNFSSNHSVNNVVLKRCKLNNTVNIQGNLSNPSQNLAMIGNVFMLKVYLDNAQFSLISNNIMAQTFLYSNSNVFNNNIIMGYVYGSSYEYLFFGNNNNLSNNIIIWDGYTAAPNGYGNTFYNNLYVEPAPTYGTLGTALGTYPGVAQTAIFVNQTGLTFNYAHDYHLQAPTTYTGTDGSEIGIYGGYFPYKEGAVPINPHIQYKNVAPTTDANGELQILIQVEAQED